MELSAQTFLQLVLAAAIAVIGAELFASLAEPPTRRLVKFLEGASSRTMTIIVVTIIIFIVALLVVLRVLT